jgi:hypothetical protein
MAFVAASIESFLTDPNTQPSISPTSFLPLYRAAITEALLNQEKIGWQNLLRGFFALSWLRLASIRPLDFDKPDSKRGNFRISQSLSALHTYTRSIWLGRNDALHKTQDKDNAKIFTAESKEIRHYFADPLLIPAEDRHYVSQSLEKILRSRHSVRRRCLRRVRTARANMIKNGQSQSTIKNFFLQIPHHDSTIIIRPTATELVDNTMKNDSTSTAQLSLAQPPPTQNMERTPGRPSDSATIPTGPPKRASTTQQRMTAFFPGRPPDNKKITNIPGNPPHI